MLISKDRWDVDAVYIPEMDIDFESECNRLLDRMDKKDSVNIFLSEGAGTDTIVEEMEVSGQEVVRDAFGHVALDTINPGKWFAEQFQEKLNADKVLVQKSGYFARSASPNNEDLDLIGRSAALAAESALAGKSGVVGLDEDKSNELGLIAFERIKGGKPFDIHQDWFQKMLKEIGQLV
jgi:pyrophosphate--fructose-6-phosphate 1-phosphotransferase